MTIPQITVLNKSNKKVFYDYEKEVISFDIGTFLSSNNRYTTPRYNTIGIDPGTSRWGFSFWDFDTSELYSYELHWERGRTTNIRIQQLYQWLEIFSYLKARKLNVVVEGPTFSDKDRYRQVELEDIRAGMVCWFPDTEIIPPNTIRKVVFGSAKIKNPWTEQGIPDNAAAALCCALYPIMLEKGKENG